MMAGMIKFKILEKTPSCAMDKTHHYCDYIELITLCNGVDGLSSSDIYVRFLEDEQIKEIGSEIRFTHEIVFSSLVVNNS